MKRIAVFGTHGAAKTSLVYRLASFFKMRNKNITVIHEAARQSPFPLNTDVVYQTTLYVVMSQIKKELEAEAEGFEISISDRTPSDAFIYINHLERDNKYTRSLEDFCMQWVKKYDVLVYLEPSEDVAIADDGIRACDRDYQMAIRDDFRFFVNEVQEYYGEDINVVKANSSQIFDDDQCLELMEEVSDKLMEKTAEPV